jgi:hypothetical protein
MFKAKHPEYNRRKPFAGDGARDNASAGSWYIGAFQDEKAVF